MPETLSPDELRRRLGEVHHWYHSIELGDGVVTPGRDDTRARLGPLAMPKDLRGKTVLDIGAWDGFFSFEAERRGASRVVAADKWAWSWPAGKRGFELARDALGSAVEDREIDVLELTPESVGRFDLVLCLGVLYHMRHPLLALERVASVTGHQLILETEVDLAFVRRPAMAFYPADELEGDETNWCGPNPPAVLAMLRSVGFSRVEVVSAGSLRYRSARAAYRLARALLSPAARSPLATAQQGRLIVHAFR